MPADSRRAGPSAAHSRTARRSPSRSLMIEVLARHTTPVASMVLSEPHRHSRENTVTRQPGGASAPPSWTNSNADDPATYPDFRLGK
jgi:hypothetical protein